MTAAYPIRPIGADEFPAFYAVIEQAFNSSRQSDAEMRHDLATFEFDRSLAAFDGRDIVGTAGAFTFQMGVPGEMAPAAGVTAVSVLPSHRRRGILSSLMHRQLADVRERGETVATLFASEAAIYGRYGYGPASAELDLTIRRGEGTMAAPPGGGSPVEPPRLRSSEPHDAIAELAKVYDGVLRGRPGLHARDDRWWDYVMWDPEHRRSGRSPLRCVIAEDDAGPRGYALFAVTPEWGEHGLPGGVLRVQELMATDPAAYAAVWGELLTRDLVAEVRARMRPADDPLIHLLADSRRARAHLLDGLWVRLVSVPGALTRRRYACAADVVIDVADDLFPENAGRWRLQTAARAQPAGPGATCERTSAPADVALPVRALGAAYLGGTRLGALAAAGLVTEIRPGALTALSAALSWDPAPWCPAIFLPSGPVLLARLRGPARLPCPFTGTAFPGRSLLRPGGSRPSGSQRTAPAYVGDWSPEDAYAGDEGNARRGDAGQGRLQAARRARGPGGCQRAAVRPGPGPGHTRRAGHAAGGPGRGRHRDWRRGQARERRSAERQIPAQAPTAPLTRTDRARPRTAPAGGAANAGGPCPTPDRARPRTAPDGGHAVPLTYGPPASPSVLPSPSAAVRFAQVETTVTTVCPILILSPFLRRCGA